MLNSAISLAPQRLQCTELDGMSTSSQLDVGDGACGTLLSHWHSKRLESTEADGMIIQLKSELGDGTR
jgi:hypothetical protein